MDFVMPYESRAYPLPLFQRYPCPVCDFPNSTYFYLYGLCSKQDPGATFDSYYKLVSDRYGNVSMQGQTTTSIYYEVENKRWRMAREFSLTLFYPCSRFTVYEGGGTFNPRPPGWIGLI